tara:strand:+ start:1210 stop:1644 length:435 start_codon:yes stop_codon:yes gene_type:complete
MSAFYDYFSSLFSKLTQRAQDSVVSTSTNSSPNYVTNDSQKIVIDWMMGIIYFVVCFTVIISATQLGMSNQSVVFLTLGITYAMITVSLSSTSLFFVFLEVLACTSIIELVSQLGYNNFAWVIVFCLPVITVAQSIYFLLFYLS